MDSGKFLLLLVLCCGLGFFLWKKEEKSTNSSQAFPVTEEKPFVIIIPSYNNEHYAEKNLRSVFSQEYDNFRVIYIDDNSCDSTLESVNLLISELDTEKRTSIIHNTENQGGLANVFNAAHTCLDHEIIVLLDGDDFLAHENVLSSLNAYYANPNLWLTYGNHLEYPSYLPSKPSKQIDRAHFTAPPLRSFYAALFKKIHTEDLIYRGKFYPMAWDFALMLPMVEMAGQHAQFLEETFYLSNSANPLYDRRINPQYHAECEEHIRSKSPYHTLKKLGTTPHAPQEKVDLVIFSYDNPMQLYCLLETLEEKVTGLNKISVLYRVSSTHMDTAYLEIKLKLPKVHFVRQDSPPSDFKKLLNTLVFEESLPSSNYIVFAPDSLVVTAPIDLSMGILALERTNAYALFYSLHEQLRFCSSLKRFQPIPVHTSLPGIPAQEPPFLWEFAEGVDDFNTPGTLHFALYRKEDLRKSFHKLDFDSPKTLLFEWGQLAPPRVLGLFFPSSKVIEILPKKDKDFLENFTSGLKIDIRPLIPTLSPSQKIERDIIFTSK